MTTHNFKFNLGDRVRFLTPGPMNGKQGVIVGQYGRRDDIPRLRDTVVATVPWTELMYTVRLDGQNPEAEDPAIIEESSLRLLTV